MSYTELRELFKGDTYVTGDVAVHPLSRVFPSLYFYPALMHQVVKAANMVQKRGYNGELWADDCYTVFRYVERAGAKVIIEGMNHYKTQNGPCVIVANHMSTLETVTIASFVQPFLDMGFVVKKSLSTYPIAKHFINATNPIMVNRVNPREDLTTVLTEGVKQLSTGRSIVVFPQNTRSTKFAPELFNSIGVKLAKKAGVPVMPLALKTDAWGCGTLSKEFGPFNPKLDVHYRFGAPMDITGNGKEQHAAATEFIMQALSEWQEKALV
ncbi:MAG: lysophospholipid acyltransferase family protein [Pseudomonadota bacterium]